MTKKIKAMVISVGGSVEPLIVTINSHQPEFVCFFASEQSVDKIGEIKQGVNVNFADRKVIVSDPQDLLECYHKSMECVERLREAGYERDEVLIDFTGGTKPMSGTLLAASLAEGYNFVYVGGKERDKNSLGVVISGKEMIINGPNPWDIYAVEHRKKLCLYFNRYQFSACLEIINEALDRCQADSPEEELFKGLMDAVNGYLEWDRFEHRKARDLLSKGYKSLDLFARLTGNNKIKSFIQGLKINLDYLNQFSQSTRNYQDLSRWHVLDLLGNAKRRACEGKHDDAVARIYRALEMSAQWKLLSGYGINTSRVKPDEIPEGIREAYRQKYLDGDILKLPLAASFNLLHALQDPMGDKFIEMEEEINKILYTRNHSILAHGIKPVGTGVFEKFNDVVLRVCNIEAGEIPVFPVLEL